MSKSSFSLRTRTVIFWDDRFLALATWSYNVGLQLLFNRTDSLKFQLGTTFVPLGNILQQQLEAALVWQVKQHPLHMEIPRSKRVCFPVAWKGKCLRKPTLNLLPALQLLCWGLISCLSEGRQEGKAQCWLEFLQCCRSLLPLAQVRQTDSWQGRVCWATPSKHLQVRHESPENTRSNLPWP